MSHRVRLFVSEEGAGPERQAEIAGDLQAAVLDMHAGSVQLEPSPQAGIRGSLVGPGELMVVINDVAGILTTLLSVLENWLKRGSISRTIVVEFDGDLVESLSGAAGQVQRSAEAFAAWRAVGDAPHKIPRRLSRQTEEELSYQSPPGSPPSPLLSGPSRRREIPPSHKGHTGEPSDAEKTQTADVYAFADMPSRLQVGKLASVVCNVSRTQIATAADRVRAEGRMTADLSRRITLEVLPRANVEVVGDARADIPAPAEGETSAAYFDIRPTHHGMCQVWIIVRQGPVPLLTLRLEAPATLEPAPSPVERNSAGADVAVRETTGLEDGTWLSVLEMDRGPETVYRFELRSTTLQILATFESPPLRHRAEYVASLYRDIENRWLTSAGDVEAFQEELREFGGSLLSQLFPERLQEILWRLRDSLKDLIVLSGEPFIPWELVHLKEPGGPLPDETRFLAETGLTRWLYTRDNAYPPQALHARPGRVRTLCPDYPDPDMRLPQARTEADFLAASFGATPVPPNDREVRALLRAGGFDILHFAGHGQADGEDFANARIFLEGRRESGRYIASTLSATTVDQQARLAGPDGSKPLVVLNACQTGRLGQQLSSLGGFAQAFLERGAGAFISSMWSTGDEPASIFVTTFYQELLRGQPISAAASKARQEARQAGDGTWLAYAVYAHPQAQLLMSSPAAPAGEA
jgi:CHAT domain